LALFSNNGANLRNFEGAMSITSEGDFQVITLGAENIRVNSADGKVGIGNPASVPEMLTVNGSIQQSGVLSALLKTNSSGKLIAAVAGTDYVVPSALSSYVPTSRELTINGTTYDLSANRSWTITSDITGSGADGRVAYWNGTNSLTSEAGFIYDASTNRLGVNTSVPNATIGADAALDSGYGLLIKTGASNYNGIGIAIDSTYGNLISTEKLGSATARNLTLLNQSGFVSLTESGSFGVGILTPNNGIDIYNSTQSQLWLHNAASGITGTDGVRLALFNNLSANLRNFDGGLSLTAEGDFSIITIGAENIRVNSANGFVGIGNPTTLTNLLTVNGSASVNSNLDIRKSSGLATLNFPFTIGQNDPAFIQHDESTVNTGIMRFSVGDDDLANDYFVFGNTSSGFVERFRITANGIVNLGTWQGSAIADAYISSAATWNAKQNQLNGTGFVKASGTTITYDNSTYLTTSAAASTYLALTGGTLTGALGGTSASFSSTLTAGDTTIINVAPILAIQSNTTGNIFLRFRQSADTMASLFYTNATATFTMSNNIGGLRFNTSGTSDAMNILGDGKVGIATNTPSQLLTIQYPFGKTDTTQRYIADFRSNDVSNPFALTMGVKGAGTLASRAFTMQTADNNLANGGNISLQPYGGNVGIGTNTANIIGFSGPMLTIAGTGQGQGIEIWRNSNTIPDGEDLGLITFLGGTSPTQLARIVGKAVGTNEDAGGLSFQTCPSGGGVTERMRIASNGKVTINPTIAGDDIVNIVNTSSTGYGMSVQGGVSSNYSLTVRDYTGSARFTVFGNGGVYAPNIGAATGTAMILDSAGFLRTLSSSIRYKKDIKPIDIGLDFILSLNPVSYNLKDSDKAQVGFIAEDFPEERLVSFSMIDSTDKSKGYQREGVNYAQIVAPLVKAIQEQQAQIEELKQLILNK
jgi:hypothetical protein